MVLMMFNDRGRRRAGAFFGLGLVSVFGRWSRWGFRFFFALPLSPLFKFLLSFFSFLLLVRIIPSYVSEARLDLFLTFSRVLGLCAILVRSGSSLSLSPLCYIWFTKHQKKLLLSFFRFYVRWKENSTGFGRWGNDPLRCCGLDLDFLH